MSKTSISFNGLLITLALVCQSTGQAAQVNPFFARVAVSDRSDDSLAEGQRRALVEVLVKLSGHPESVRDATTDAVLEQASGMLQSYRFVSRPTALLLEAHFDPAAVQRLASELALPVWPLERGEALAWIAFDNGSGRQLLGMSPDHEALQTLVRDGAQANAVPLVLPQLNEDSTVTAASVWGGFVDQLRAPSAAYNTRYLLVGRIYAVGSAWRSNWTLDDGSPQQLRWSAGGSDAQETIDRAFSDLAQRLAQRYASAAPSEHQSGRIMMRVYGIDSADSYGRIISYLNRLSTVSRADPVEVRSEFIDLEVVSSSGVGGLTRLFQLERMLLPSPQTAAGIDVVFELAQ